MVLWHDIKVPEHDVFRVLKVSGIGMGFPLAKLERMGRTMMNDEYITAEYTLKDCSTRGNL